MRDPHVLDPVYAVGRHAQGDLVKTFFRISDFADAGERGGERQRVADDVRRSAGPEGSRARGVLRPQRVDERMPPSHHGLPSGFDDEP